MWDRRLHTLKLLTELTSVYVEFKWTSVEQEAFDEIKQIAAKETPSHITIVRPTY